MALTRFLALLVPLALLSACGDDAAEDGEGRSPAGEVMEGTISDSMLPLDQLRSEPPLLEPEAAPVARGNGAREANATAAEPETASEPAESEADEPEADETPAGE